MKPLEMVRGPQVPPDAKPRKPKSEATPEAARSAALDAEAVVRRKLVALGLTPGDVYQKTGVPQADVVGFQNGKHLPHDHLDRLVRLTMSGMVLADDGSLRADLLAKPLPPLPRDGPVAKAAGPKLPPAKAVGFYGWEARGILSALSGKASIPVGDAMTAIRAAIPWPEGTPDDYKADRMARLRGMLIKQLIVYVRSDRARGKTRFEIDAANLASLNNHTKREFAS